MKKTLKISSWMLIFASLSFLVYSCTKDSLGPATNTVETPDQVRLLKVDRNAVIEAGNKASIDDVSLIQDLVDEGKLSGNLVKVTSANLNLIHPIHHYLFVRGEDDFGQKMFTAYPIIMDDQGLVKLLVALPAPSCTGQNGCEHCEQVETNGEVTGCDCQTGGAAWCKFENCKTQHGETHCCTSMRSCQKCDFVSKNDSIQSCSCQGGPTGGWCRHKLTVKSTAVVDPG